MKRIFFYFVLILLLLLFNPATIDAADYKTDYDVKYFLTESQGSISSRAIFDISITNLQSDTYLKKFTLIFPKSFQIKNTSARSDTGEVITNVHEDDSNIQIEVELTDPNTGANSTNGITLEFDQENLFIQNGNVWEVILPTIANEENSNYNVTVHLPIKTNRRISIAKPKPDLIRGNEIIWRNPKVKTIYAVFGDKQYYKMQLVYNIENTKLTPVYTDIAFPPDTQLQKTYVDSINPKPSEVYIDDDGNFIGRYVLKPKEKQIIIYKGTAEIFSHPRTDNFDFIRRQYDKQKKYLLTAKDEWNIKSIEKIKVPKTPNEIYYFTVNALEYDYQKILKNNKRLGAEAALLYPNQAVCTEYTDLFVATAREKGIASREIEGYGFSNDEQLRPLSSVSDVLHAWPEYYDLSRNSWIPVDPTWEDTSGIDYFSSFDLNHIVFVIHGKDPNYPHPAGAYKTADTKDIAIESVSKSPKSFSKLILDSVNFPTQINNRQTYKLEINMKNEGNVYELDLPVEIKSKNLVVSPSNTRVTLLPYEKKLLTFHVKASLNSSRTKEALEVYTGENKQYTQEVKVVPVYYDYSTKFIFIVLPIGLTIIAFILYKRYQNDSQR